MIISDGLKGTKLLYIETAPFIYFTEQRAGYFEKMVALFTYVNQAEIQVITAALTLTETLIKPLQNEDQDLVEQYRSLFYGTEGITTVSITPQVGDRAAHLRAAYGLKTPDALHIATAMGAGCDAFLTNDLGLKRVTELSILILDDLEIAPPED